VSILKHYDLDPIVKCFRDDLEFFKDLILSYRVQGVEIPKRLKELKKNVENQISKIERKENE